MLGARGKSFVCDGFFKKTSFQFPHHVFGGYCRLTKMQFNNTEQADIVLLASLYQSYVQTVMVLSNLIALPSKKIRITTKPVSVINAYTTMLKY